MALAVMPPIHRSSVSYIYDAHCYYMPVGVSQQTLSTGPTDATAIRNKDKLQPEAVGSQWTRLTVFRDGWPAKFNATHLLLYSIPFKVSQIKINL